MERRPRGGRAERERGRRGYQSREQRSRGGPPGEPHRQGSKRDGQEAVDRVLHGLTLSTAPPPYLSPDNIRFTQRPDGGGEVGRRIAVLANFFALAVDVRFVLHHDVEIRPKDEAPPSIHLWKEIKQRAVLLGQEEAVIKLLPMKLSRAILDACSHQHQWPVGWVYDGRKNLFCPRDFFGEQLVTFDVDMDDGDRHRTFEVRLRGVAAIDMQEIQRFLQRGDIDVPRSAIQSLEVCSYFHPCCQEMPLSIQFFGKSIYFSHPSTNMRIAEGAELWLGYHQGVKLCQGGLMLNVESTYAAFTQRQPVMELLERAVGRDRLGSIDAKTFQAMNRAVANVLIQTTHMPHRQRKYRCQGLTDQPASRKTFVTREGETKTVEAYWRETYGPLEFPWLPCLDVSKGRRVIYLPPEVCEIVPGQRVQKLSPNQARDMIRFSAQNPSERVQSILSAIDTANIQNDSNAKEFGVHFDPEMAKCDARVLPQPCLEYQWPESMNVGERGAWNLENVRFLKSGQIRSWAVASTISKDVALRQGPQGLERFILDLIQALNDTGITTPDHHLPPLIHLENKTIEEMLRESIQEAIHQYGLDPDLILVLLQERKEPGQSSMYVEIKQVAERELGVVTQCFVARSAGIGGPGRNRAQYLANMAMKINHKTGGINTQIATDVARMLPSEGPVMILGSTVLHPTAFESSEFSIGAIVGSMDPELGQYAARSMTMDAGENRMPIKDLVVDLLRQYYEVNKKTPQSIIYYRSGISEGVFHTVLEFEYAQFQYAFATLSPQYRPRITMVVVQKTHHTRLFPMNPEDGDPKGNVRPGTCVDSHITSKYEFDFYLNSHAGIQGTNKPAHYYVLVDENGFTSDGLQLFTYWMCYLYCRCTRSVSFCPAAYYAHLAAVHGRYLTMQRTDSSSNGSGESNQPVFHQNLFRKMFFV